MKQKEKQCCMNRSEASDLRLRLRLIWRVGKEAILITMMMTMMMKTME